MVGKAAPAHAQGNPASSTQLLLCRPCLKRPHPACFQGTHLHGSPIHAQVKAACEAWRVRRSPPPFQLVVVSYDSMPDLGPALEQLAPKCVLLDEAHYIKSDKVGAC